MTDLLVEHFGDYVDVAFTARMEEELDEIARGERAWVPLLRAFYAPLRDRVAEKRKELKRSDFTTEATDEVCSEGHPMVIRLGRNGRFLACSLYPEHKESRPLPGDELPPQEGSGEVCPKCGEGTLVGKNGRFGPFLGCSRYPDCDYIKKDGPPPPDPLPFEVICPKNKDGHLVPRRARRTGNVFWGCSKYPKCDYTTNNEPLGGLHDADDGPLARKGDAAICLDLRLDERHRTRRHRPRRALRGRPAESGGAGAAGPWRRTSRRWRAPAAVLAGRRGAGTRGTTRRARPTEPAAERVSAVAGEPATHPTLERFLRSLAARDASPHTIRAYTTAVGAYLAWLGERGVDWRRPRGPTCAPTSPAWAARPRAIDRGPAARGDPLVPPLGRARRAGGG